MEYESTIREVIGSHPELAGSTAMIDATLDSREFVVEAAGAGEEFVAVPAALAGLLAGASPAQLAKVAAILKGGDK